MCRKQTHPWSVTMKIVDCLCTENRRRKKWGNKVHIHTQLLNFYCINLKSTKDGNSGKARKKILFFIFLMPAKILTAVMLLMLMLLLLLLRFFAFMRYFLVNFIHYHHESWKVFQQSYQCRVHKFILLFLLPLLFYFVYLAV